ncbi:APC family permease [Actinomadura rugatobispora]|uniref:APC family permease n=1 Tax=Actinomadura rugatobispora TaxID=1994 RepID=A0ABW1A2M9_9ACTN
MGRPLRSAQVGRTLLPKRLALPVFCSDPLSSNAYATEEILLALSLGGLALLHLAPWVALAVAVLLAVVVLSYRQTCHEYPQGGGAYTVSRENLGTNASLVAAAALLVDYVLTVAVSVSAGVANLVSAVPSLAPHAVPLCLAAIVVLAVVNLRGARQSGFVFAIPTYGFIAVVLVMIVWGALRAVHGGVPPAESAGLGIRGPVQAGGLLAVALLLRAFSQGCTALTGVEAVSNGVPSFRPPKGRNAADTLAVMGVLTIVLFAGITVLALASRVRVAPSPGMLTGAPPGYAQKTVIVQVADAVAGHAAWLPFLVAGFTAAILVLAANTAFNGFPVLAGILGADGYLPRQFAHRGDRLVFSNGLIILAGGACLLIWAFDAATTRLIQLYIIGVFVSFTLSQAGMVRHWTRRLRQGAADGAGTGAVHGAGAVPRARALRRARAVNACGAALTALVLVVVLTTKFTHGAWIVVIAIPAAFVLMKAVRRHYTHVEEELQPPAGAVTLPARVHAVVLVTRCDIPTLEALAFARATHPDTLAAVAVQTTGTDIVTLRRQWDDQRLPVPLTILDSPYRDITGPVLDYVTHIRRRGPRDVVCVFIPEYVVGHWWEQVLHNQSALRLKIRLRHRPGIMIASVPWRLASARNLKQPPGHTSNQ